MRAKARIFSELGAKARILFRTALTKKLEKQIKTYNKSQTLDFILNQVLLSFGLNFIDFLVDLVSIWLHLASQGVWGGGAPEIPTKYVDFEVPLASHFARV